MAEREDDRDELGHFAFIEVEPTELVTKGDGSVFVAADMRVFAANQEVADVVAEEFLRMTGGQLTGKPSENRVAFSRNNWNAPWNPKGPKPNWRVDPPRGDPSLN